MGWLDNISGHFRRISTTVAAGTADGPGSAAATVGKVANTLAATKTPADPRETKLRPVVQKATWDGPASSFFIAMQGPRAGLVPPWFDRFPDPFSFWLHGKVVIGDHVLHPPRLSTLKVTADFGGLSNPALYGEVSGASFPVELDGSFAVPVSLFLRDKSPTWRLGGALRIEGTTLPTERADITFEHLTLRRLVDLVDTWERAQPVTRLHFIAMVRKVMLPAPAFDIVISNHETVPPLFPSGSIDADRLKAASKAVHRGELVNISHALVGIEGGAKQKPQPQMRLLRGDPKTGEPKLVVELDPQLLRVDLAVTWAGDLGKSLTLYLAHKYFRAYLKMNPTPGELRCAAMLAAEDRRSECLECFRQESATPEDLLGDIDGVNLAARYDPVWSLADNLRAYYYGDGDDYYGDRGDSRRRYSEFLVHTLDGDGRPALALAAGSGPRHLTTDARMFIARQIAMAANAGLIVRVWENRALLGGAGGVLAVLVNAPPVVMDLLKPESWAVQQLTQSFVDFIESGLAKEPSS